MKLIVGLGNPESRYAQTRHNVGFHSVEEFAHDNNVEFIEKKKFNAKIAELTIDSEKLLLVMPQTYYNDSGHAVQAIASFYSINPSDVLIIHDELMLPFGTIRTRIGGSAAGNNGLKSIEQHFSQDTNRVRIGIYNPLRDRIPDADFVLSKFTAFEAAHMEVLQSLVSKVMHQFANGTFSAHTEKIELQPTD